MTTVHRPDWQVSQLVQEDGDAGTFRVARKVFTDPEVLELERRLIFSRCWLYLGHSSELLAPNDYLTRSVGGRQIIFNRDRKGNFAAFHNSCPHRGAKVAREKCGNAMAFKCFYHGWTFNNNGKFALRSPEGTYPAGFEKSSFPHLKPVAKLQSYRDFWFVNFDADAGNLSDYLGGIREMIDIVTDHSPDGMEIIGDDQRYFVGANWKLLVENSVDGYHAHETHSTYLDYLRNSFSVSQLVDPNRVTTGRDFGNGHGAMEGPMPWGRPVGRWVPSFGDEAKADIDLIRAELEDRLGAERAKRIAELSRNIAIFPNLIINDIMAITVRTFYPEAPDRMMVSSWAFGPKGEGAELRERRLNNFLEFLGPGGFATPDDVEALESCQASYSNNPEVEWNDLSRGLLREGGSKHDDEEQLRAFWRGWVQQMEAEA